VPWDLTSNAVPVGTLFKGVAEKPVLAAALLI